MPGGNLGVEIVASIAEATSISLVWNKASDNEADDGNLTYRVYYSDATLGADVASVEAATPAGPASSNIDSYLVNGLSPDTTYYFNVVVADAAGNKSIYNELTQKTAADSTSPVAGAGSSTVLAATSITETSLNVAWNKASDDFTAQSSLSYRLYYSQSTLGTTVAEVETASAMGAALVDISSL